MSIDQLWSRFENLTARSSDRAVLFWGLAITAGAGLAVSEANYVSAVAAAAAMPFCPAHLSKFRRFALLAIGIAASLAGPICLLVAAPGALLLAATPGSSAVALLALASAASLSHHFQSVPNFAGLPLHAGSLGFVIVPSITAMAAFGGRIGWRAALAMLGAALAIILLMVAGAGRWITYLTFTSPLFRTMAAVLPVCAALPWLSSRPERYSETGGEWMLWFAIVGAVVTLFIHSSPIRTVVFDESHGRWATVQSQYGPTDFGRSVNYTYSLLARYGARLVGTVATFDSEEATLPERDALFVLKMPTKPLSEEFSRRLEKWVREGGRLLVVADHTDLYDTAQNLNAFLSERFGMRINSDAVFDARGMPTVPTVETLAAVIGRIDALAQPLPWQTGTSLAGMPPNAVQLSTFGMSFSEPGDYSRPNRFGPLASRVSLRFANHTAIAAFGADKGAIAIVLDSTPWSNFSIFKEEYKRLFRGIIHSLSNPIALHVWGWSAIALGLTTLVLAFWRVPAVMAAGGLMLGLSAGTAAQIGVTSFYSQVEGRDFRLRVIVGPTSRLEFLKQLVGPGERNFSRIISAMSKYDLEPSASTPGTKVVRLKDASKWLLIQPDVRQLPSSEEVISHLHARGDLTVLFAPEQAAQNEVRAWLGELGLYIQEATALAMSEDARPGQEGLLNRRGAAIMREIRPLTRALPTSLLKDGYADQFVQSYTVRPTSFPRSSGLLNIGFSADQFSDAAIGDVWEGIQPATIGMLRERQLAAALEGKDLPSPFPERLALPSSGVTPSTLAAYLLMEDGTTVLAGHFDASSVVSGAVLSSPIENPVMYLFDLRGRAASFIASSCPRTGKLTHCKVRMLGPDMVEWAVSWASNDDGTPAAVELLHERSFSGLGKTVNVLFGD
jgi:hypothetical protein